MRLTSDYLLNYSLMAAAPQMWGLLSPQEESTAVPGTPTGDQLPCLAQPTASSTTHLTWPARALVHQARGTGPNSSREHSF